MKKLLATSIFLLIITSFFGQINDGKWHDVQEELYMDGKNIKASQLISPPADWALVNFIGKDGQVYRFFIGDDGFSLDSYEVSAKSFATDKDGYDWIVENNGVIKRGSAGEWKTMPGKAKQICYGGTKLFVIGMDDQIYEWDGKTWIRGGVYAKSIAVDKDNSIWVVDKNSNAIKRYKDAKWTTMPGYARKVFAGGKRVLIIGTDGQMYEWNFKTDNSWTRGGVYPSSIAVDPAHRIWMIDKDGHLKYIGW